MIVQLVWGHVHRPWGYEVRVDLEHDGATLNEVLTFPTEPDAATLAARIESLRVKLEEREAVRLSAEAEVAAGSEFLLLTGL